MALLILSPAGGGKTTSVQAALRDLKARDPLAKAWVLVSTERQIIDFRRRYMLSNGDAGGRATFNVEHFGFYDLYRRILAIARQPGRILTPPARQALIGALLRQRFSTSPVFGAIAGTPGFARAIASLIDELKQCRILPDQFRDAATTPRERELAAIYTSYLDLLQQYDLIDREGEGWLAIEALEHDKTLVSDVALLVVDGYDQFNSLQVALLEALDRQVGEMRITLATAPTERITQTFAALMTAFESRITPDHLPDDGIPSPTRAWIEAPSPAAEAAAVMRDIKRKLVGGATPESIVVAVRDWARYADALIGAAHAYDIPTAAHYAPAPSDNPAIAALIAALNLHRDGFRRRAVLDVLRSPYIGVTGLDAASIDSLDRISRDARVIGGTDEWRAAIASAVASPGDSLVNSPDDNLFNSPDDDLFNSPDDNLFNSPDDDLFNSPDDNLFNNVMSDANRDSDAYDEDDGATLRLGALAGTALSLVLDLFFETVTPPDTGTSADYIAWLEGLIGVEASDPDDPGLDSLPSGGTLALLEHIRAQDDELRARDLTALKRLKDILRALLATERLADHIGLSIDGDRESFLESLFGALDSQPVARGAGRDGRVLITLTSDARGLPHAHVYVVGLAEGLFPARIPDDPLLLDTERARLRQRGIGLPAAADRADDAGLFASVIGIARQTLILSRPTVKNGESWAPSPLWLESRAGIDAAVLAAHTTHLAIGASPTLDGSAGRDEAALAMIESLRAGTGALDGGRWLRWAYPAFARHLGRAIRVERARRSPSQAHDHTSGVLRDPALVALASAEVTARIWSASALNDYGACPYRYFAHRLLGIDPARDPEDGMDARQRGTLLHEILETAYRRIAADAIVIMPDDPDALARALAVLDATCNALLPGAPARIGFRASSSWAGEQTTVRRQLRALLVTDFSDKHPLTPLITHADSARRPFRLESRFGGGAVPLTLRLDDSTVIAVRGTIDRLDTRADGGLFVIDYKSGSTPIDSREIVSGRNVQMWLYLEAAQQLYPGRVVGGVFWHIATRTGSGALDVTTHDEVLSAGKARVTRHLSRMKSGDFRSRPSKLESGKCSHYCDFYQLCRPMTIARDKTG